MSHRYLLELGTEEIPAEMIAPALGQLQQGFEQLLSDRGIEFSAVETGSTPRRLTIWVDGICDREPDRVEAVTGPPRSAAYDEQGQPTAAARGFARKLGVEPDDLKVISTEKGEYVGLERRIEGRPVVQILSKSIPSLVAALSWPRNMYWRPSRFRYIRPLRWFVSLWDTEVVPFEMEGVEAGRTSRGHRSLGRHDVEIASVDDYEDRLRDNFVIIDPAERRRLIERGLSRETSEGIRVRDDDALLEMVVQLNEYPSVIRGDFDPRYLEIPQEVLVTVMRFHQKYFSMQDSEGRLAPHFLTVTNSDGDPSGEIRSGHEKVLRARLEDAAFFWQADRRRPLKARVDDLAEVLFQEDLGSYLDKTVRLRQLVAHLDSDGRLDEAAALAKADLTTDMVREFPELQGVMGGLYARADKSEAWEAVYGHYEPVGADDPVPENRLAALLSLADRLDTIVGCFGVGIVPTGSRDPFALRRQARGAVRILLHHELEFSLAALVQWARAGYPDSRDDVDDSVVAFLERRLERVLQDEGIAADVVVAVLATGEATAADLAVRSRAVSEMTSEEDFQALAAAFKRIRNLLDKSAGDEAETREVAQQLFEEPAERGLFEAYEELEPRLREFLQDRDYPQALREMAGLRGVVDTFFDQVMVMVDDAAVRRNRLALLRRLEDLFGRVADISKIDQRRTA